MTLEGSAPVPPSLAISTGDPNATVLLHRFEETRRLSFELAAPLSPEDMAIQAIDDASPTKWHLAHTTWFFETFILKEYGPDYRCFDEAFDYCFNSYYESQGPRHPRPARGLLTRPSIDCILEYRAYVDGAVMKLLVDGVCRSPRMYRILETGINHEQQHQELMLTDILALFAANPLRPAYRGQAWKANESALEPLRWIDHEGGICPIGHVDKSFAWDNEGPQHDVFVYPFRLADRLTTNAEWLEFMSDGGYDTALLWLSDGWATAKREEWSCPLYWEERDGTWFEMTLDGLVPLIHSAPVSHISYFEADAFARWAGKRLPTEFEWEIAARDVPLAGNTLGSSALRPLPAPRDPEGRLRQMFGDVWEWTSSAYAAYPRFKSAEGALGEYNGKFMINQQVLRGASCATPDGHSRRTYRNFFYPHQRWQFFGLRLAEDMAP